MTVARRLWRYPTAVFALLALSLVVAIAVFAPQLAQYEPNLLKLQDASQPPGADHLLGTDVLGRDVLARLLYATRVSLFVAVTAVTLNVLIGTLLGSAAGYLGGRLDYFLSQVADAFLSFPVLPLVIVLVALFGPSLLNVILALGLVGWPEVFRLVRGETLSVKEREFVQAAVSLGGRSGWIIFRHVLPNVVAPVVVAATFGMAQAVLTEAGLSFLGLGLRPPNASLGNMLLEAQSITVLESHPWLWLPPGIMIIVIVLSVNFLGDALRTLTDPRART